MATNIRLKDGNGVYLHPETNADIVNVPENQSAVTLTDKLADIKYYAEIDTSSVSYSNGIIASTGKWSSSSTYKSKIIDISTYKGLKLLLRRNGGGLVYALLKSSTVTSGELLSYCSDNFVVTVSSGTNSVTLDIPEDCNYLYLYSYSNGNVITPYVAVMDDSDSLSVGKAINSLIGVNDNAKVLKVVYPLREQMANGYVNASGKFTVSSTYRGTFTSLSAYRGKKIRIYVKRRKELIKEMGGSQNLKIYMFTKSAPTTTTSGILCSNTKQVNLTGVTASTADNYPDYYDEIIPNDCNYLYEFVYNNGNIYACSDPYIIYDDGVAPLIENVADDSLSEFTDDDDDMNSGTPKVARVFSHYFPSISSDSELTGLEDATVTSSGITLTDYTTPIIHNKLFVFDDEEITLEVTASNTDKVMMYCYNDLGNIGVSSLSSYVLFDFANGAINVYKSSTVASDLTGTVLHTESFTAPSASTDYILSIGRNRRNIFARVYNKSTREEVYTEINDEDYPYVSEEWRPAGWLYRYPAFATITGTPTYIRFNGYTKSGLFMLFQGDSLTQGYAGSYKQCWAYKAAKYFRNSRTCGISGGTLADLIQQYHESIKGKVEVNVMVISIGGNDINSLTSDALITQWIADLKDYCDELVADGITPIINRNWFETNTNATKQARAIKISNGMRTLGYDGADFSAVTGSTTNTTYWTIGHLTPKGNELTYEIFINELAMYKQD